MQTDPIQLHQKMIYYKAELEKYKGKVSDYENNYHYSQLTKLKEDNVQLLEDKERLSCELDELKEKYHQELQVLNKQITAFTAQEAQIRSTVSNQLLELQKLEKENTLLLDEIILLQETKNDLHRTIEIIKKQLTSTNLELLQNKSDIEKLTNENIALKNSLNKQKSYKNELQNENGNLNQENKQFKLKIQQLEEAFERNEWFRNEMKHMHKNQHETNAKIEDLKKMIDWNHHHHNLISYFNNTSDELIILSQLHDQFQELLKQSFDYEEKLDLKIILINELEHKLQTLTNEIEKVNRKKKYN